ncbi:MAG: hypothetical protein RMY35_032465 [Nostoc sp. DedSLP01]
MQSAAANSLCIITDRRDVDGVHGRCYAAIVCFKSQSDFSH